MNQPSDESLAVVVALTDKMPYLEASLARFAEEAGPLGEVLLVDASRGSDVPEIAGRFPNVRVIPRPVGRLAPRLWRDGLLATNADLVAFSTAQMVPARGWIEALKARMRETGAAGVGGPIEPGSGLSSTDQAVALLRYANYFPTRDEHASPASRQDVSRRVGLALPNPRHRQGYPTGSDRLIHPPGDNALYRRDRLMSVESSWLDGFWESEVHEALRDRGESLAMADGAMVAFVGGVGLASMIGQRFRHARRYAVGRSGGLEAMARWSRVAAAPLVPPLLCLRALRALRSRGMALRPWILAGPALVVLATAWAIGEAAGTLPGDRTRNSMTPRISEVA